jgi:AcrR family transcriptional regulator
MDERERICEAMVDVVLERGYEGATVGLVAARAGVSEETFRRHFADEAECFMAVFRRYVGVFESRVVGAFGREDDWRAGLRAAAYAAAGYIRDYPRETRFGGIQILGAGPLPQAHSGNFLQRIVDLIDAGRQELDDPDSMSRGVAEGVLGSVYESLLRELQRGEVRAPEDFVPELMYIAVRPYLGHEAAREELAIPPPPEMVRDG